MRRLVRLLDAYHLLVTILGFSVAFWMLTMVPKLRMDGVAKALVAVAVMSILFSLTATWGWKLSWRKTGQVPSWRIVLAAKPKAGAERQAWVWGRVSFGAWAIFVGCAALLVAYAFATGQGSFAR